MILSIQQGLQAEGFKVSMSQLCRWFEVPRRTAYYKPCKAAPKVQERFEKPIKAMIDQDPSFGYGGAKQSQTQVRNQILAKTLPGLTIKNSIGEHQWCLTMRAYIATYPSPRPTKASKERSTEPLV